MKPVQMHMIAVLTEWDDLGSMIGRKFTIQCKTCFSI
jgi:hypothetical protein